ncbi:MAG: 16S rRNA (cytidine(1402)-2'-O)-methyltransferase [Pseudomonadota bacterium]
MTGRTYALGDRVFDAPPLEAGLYIVATPIGNLRDITLRALDVLAGCDLLACEDTRVTRKLLDRYSIRVPRLIAYHEHNSDHAGEQILAALDDEESVALVSDAGTPLVSDPGYKLVIAARGAGHKVWPIPGASSVLAAMSASGLPTDDFRFVGFLPTKKSHRDAKLRALANSESTIAFFESPKRLIDTLNALGEIMGGDRRISVARELTKLHETVLTGTVRELTKAFDEKQVRGEIVVLLEPAEAKPDLLSQEALDELLKTLLSEMSASNAAKKAAVETGLAKSELYQRCLALKATNAN